MTVVRFRASLPAALLPLALALACSSGSGPAGQFDEAPGPELPDGTEPDLLADILADDGSVPLEDVATCQTRQECLDLAGSPCMDAVCEPTRHVCLFSQIADGTSCDTGTACVVNGACWAGQCLGAAAACDDGDPCTDDSCDPVGGCSHAFGTATCDDGNPCTGNDVCNGGACVGGANTCACDVDADCAGKLQGDLCKGRLACDQHVCVLDPTAVVHCEQPAERPCVVASCSPATGLCVERPLSDGVACDDGNRCTLGESCSAGVCKGGSTLECDDDNPCTDNACDAALGCRFTPNTATCNDGNGCTTADRCRNGVCVGDRTDDCGCRETSDCAPFEDQNRCNGTLMCRAGQCIVDVTTLVVCDRPPEAVCVRSECVVATGLCRDVPLVEGRACDDATPCTLQSACHLGKCAGTSFLSCDDGNVCTTDSCAAPDGCAHAPVTGTICNDSNACTLTDTCQSGLCTGGDPIVCTAADQCHEAGVCNPANGQCSSPPKDDLSGCDDGNACTRDDACMSGVCEGGSPVLCTPSDPCHVAGVCDRSTGICTDPPADDDSTCDDGDACTQIDSCQAGVCTGADPVSCTAQDQCHVPGACDPATGTCSNPPRDDLEGCDDGDACTRADACQGGACVGADPVVCTPLDPCHDAGTCDPIAGTCSDPAKDDGADCDDNDACTVTDTCQDGICTAGTPVVCTALDPCHDVGVCDPATGVCSNPPKGDGSPCTDGDACTLTDSCQGGACVGTDPVVCTPLDQCHDAGTCDPFAGTCSDPAKDDGADCDDLDACTATDTCQDGICTGSDPVACTASDPCHVAGVCDPATGTCSDPAADDGADCDDGDACTATDTCQDGICTGADPVSCTAMDSCHDVGVCDPADGTCSNPPRNDGATCDLDSDRCTTDSCLSGACTAGAAVTCTAQDQCHVAGTCDPGTGACSNPPKGDGTPCSADSDVCTTDTCQAGTCVAIPKDCTAHGPCEEVGTCNPVTGACETAPVLDGTGCDDGNACTRIDTCQAGRCQGGDPVVCTAQDQCHVAGTCDPFNGGTCSNPPQDDGVSCDDGDACTTTDTCQTGVCTGANPVVCPAPGACRLPGTCNPATGVCSNPVAPTNAPCDLDSSLCTPDFCVEGSCTAGTMVVCTALDQCHNAGTCNPNTGICSNPPKVSGASCDDGDACTQTDTCQSGTCRGLNPVTCFASDACHDAGVCNPATGDCSDPPTTDGTPCDDLDACTQADTCQSGLCTGGDPVVCTVTDPCQVPGFCDGLTGECTNFPLPDTTTCDLDPCLLGETCLDGHCQGGTADTCDDGNPDTVDSCVPGVGCRNVPVNDSCASPTLIALTGDLQEVDGTTRDASDDFRGLPCGDAGVDSPDVAYRLVLDQPTGVIASVYSAEFSPVLALLVGPCETALATWCVSSMDMTQPLALTLAAGVYTLVVDSYWSDGGSGAFQLYIESVPPF